MNAVAIESKQLVEDYFKAISGQQKTEERIDQFVSDPNLKEHIRLAESGFPGYLLVAHQMVAEGDMVAVRGTVQGTHKGTIAGIEPTGKQISAEVMLFYRVADNRIAQFWMQPDMSSLLGQLLS